MRCGRRERGLNSAPKRHRPTGEELGHAELEHDRGIRVYVRKRPIFPHETKKQREFDVITCRPNPRGGRGEQAIVHDARMHPARPAPLSGPGLCGAHS